MGLKSKKKLIIELVAIFGFTILLVIFFKYANTSKGQKKIIENKTNFSVNLDFNKIYNDLSLEGFTLVPESGSEKVLLVNNLGKIVHSWNFDAQRARLLPNCHLLVLHGSKNGIKKNKWKKLNNRVREYDFFGNLVWEYIAKNNAHHDVQRLSNGNTLFIERKIVDPLIVAKSKNYARSKAKVRSDKIVEVNKEKEIVWSWTYENHFSIDYCGKDKCRIPSKTLIERGKSLDWTHTNTAFSLPENKWYANGDKRFKAGNILVLPRNWSEVLLIDKETKKVVWSYQGDYKGGLSGGHEANMISPGLTGAGNILVFDNGRETRNGASYLLEINPITKKLDWALDAGSNLYSNAAGSIQRLSNGNTLISEDVKGRIFEITKNNIIAWIFQSKYRTARARRYPINYCKEFLKLTK